MDRPEQTYLTCDQSECRDIRPVLPVKQRRSYYSQSSSVGSSLDLEPEGGGCCSSEPQPLRLDFSAEFPTSADCHAPQCPIHRRSESSSSHQERFFSESTPPPVPMKRLTRAMSLPVGSLCPRCALYSSSIIYNNPLYRFAPTKDLEENPGNGKRRENPVPGSPVRSQPQTLLSFDTPDSQLRRFFKDFQDQEQVWLEIQRYHLKFTESFAQQLKAALLEEESPAEEMESLQLQDFVLCDGYQPQQIGGATFYKVFCPRLSGSVFSAKVFLPNSRSAVSTRSTELPPHVNIQQFILHFRCPRVVRMQRTESDSRTRPENEEEDPATEGPEPQTPPNSQLRPPPVRPAPISPCQSGTDPDRSQPEPSKSPTVLSQLPKASTVAIGRQLPRWTLEDFVQDGISLRFTQPEEYERRLCLLLLQVAQGLQHLLCHSAVCADLRPQSVILHWKVKESDGETGGGEREREAGKEELERRNRREKRQEGVTPKEPIQKLWEKLGAPRALLTSFQMASESDQAAASGEVQFGTLIRHCMHGSENARGSPEDSLSTTYSNGLFRLATLLTSSGLRMADAPGMLQVLLWGPRTEALQQFHPMPLALHNWLSVKRSLLILKLAERGLCENPRGLDWEDYLCLQYYALSSADTVLCSSNALSLHKTLD